MFGKSKKEKDIQSMLEGLTPEQMKDLQEAINSYNASQEGNATNENSTNVEKETTANANSEKGNEVAKTTDDTTPADDSNQQEPNAIPIENVMLKSDFEEYVKKFEDRLNGVASENKELKDKNEALAKENEELKQKYEKNSFGTYKNNSTNGNQEVKPKEDFKSYTSKFFK